MSEQNGMSDWFAGHPILFFYSLFPIPAEQLSFVALLGNDFS